MRLDETLESALLDWLIGSLDSSAVRGAVRRKCMFAATVR